MVIFMRLNKKGFMMAEVVVVSVIICTALVTLYTGINRVSNAYKIRNKYYDINALYMAEKANLYLINTSNISNINELITKNKSVKISDPNLNNITNIYKSNNSDSTTNIYFSMYNKNKINDLTSINGINVTFKDFVTYLDGHLDYNEEYNYIIISEICNDKDDCNYYGLKVR